MTMLPTVSTTQTQRVFPATPASSEAVVPLSLLDATTANFALTSATWIFESPTVELSQLLPLLHQSLRTTLSSYPQLCGQCRAFSSVDGLGPAGDDKIASRLAPHARRFGRVYAHFGTDQDPGVKLITAASSATVDHLHPADRAKRLALWERSKGPLKAFSPATTIAHALQPNEPDADGARKPLLAIQITELACRGLVLSIKCAHPMVDIAALVCFVKDWASVSRARLVGKAVPVLRPVFDPARVDALAAGDINAEQPDPDIIDRAMKLPMNRFDWWAPSEGCPWPSTVPSAFQGRDLPPAGSAMPWAEWDVHAPVSSYIVHLSREQVDFLWGRATQAQPAGVRISKHDAVLAHLWSCVVRARDLEGDDTSPVHCDLVLGLRPPLQLGDTFLGSPVVMANIEMAGAQVCGDVGATTRRIRDTIALGGSRDGLAAHLHGVAFEKSPQRIWQAFLGRRHLLVTTWARAGIYEVDFGFGSVLRYADGIVPDMDGCVLIKEAPPAPAAKHGALSGAKPAWTDSGVDISIALGEEDMQRLLDDPLLLPVMPVNLN
ncbi:transferase family protein [Lasiosphaeria miniovina]|uniref:Transferase family protein n=1 Tax=Lasiosphaeria miniovina TaxID=1954250 RepID=A0AA40ABQ5_9PEZI|nr:transferase family protein [Lasiosphaeria miniovina]KAK0712964.1 transferase family protein [Lasiosphaeria miniovina]